MRRLSAHEQRALGGHDVQVVRQAALVAKLRHLHFLAADLDAGLGRDHAADQPVALPQRPLDIIADLALERVDLALAGGRDR